MVFLPVFRHGDSLNKFVRSAAKCKHISFLQVNHAVFVLVVAQQFLRQVSVVAFRNFLVAGKVTDSSSHAEIRNFEHIRLAEQNVLWLDIQVNDAELM
jgi:hypothetical protein